jgi:SAM-dependent methyltransferase
VTGRVTDYDSIADRYNRRYSLYEYAGTRESLLGFIGEKPVDVLEVGCGTGHWLQTLSGHWSATAFAERPRIVGVEPSMPMLRHASGLRVRATAEHLPFADASFDRIYCVNALHHFNDRLQFFREARRLLRPGGGVMTVGKDPFAERDGWWVYDYFPETRDIDRARFAPVRTLRGELALAGFTWAESFEADHVEHVQPATEALDTGVVEPSFTSQLTVLSPDEFAHGVARIREANATGDLQLVTDFYLFATVGWIS